MTAKRIAERALEQGQTQALLGREVGSLCVLLEAFNLIAKYGNNIPQRSSTEPAKPEATRNEAGK